MRLTSLMRGLARSESRLHGRLGVRAGPARDSVISRELPSRRRAAKAGLPTVYMLWSGTAGATILLSTHRPTGRPGGSTRPFGARFNSIGNERYIKPRNERNDDENGF